MVLMIKRNFLNYLDKQNTTGSTKRLKKNSSKFSKANFISHKSDLIDSRSNLRIFKLNYFQLNELINFDPLLISETIN